MRKEHLGLKFGCEFILYYLMCIFLLMACDTPGKIILINKTGAVAHYKLITTNQKDNVEIEISGGKNNEIIQLFGFEQTWSNDTLKEYVDNIQELVLITNKDTVTLSQQAEIFEFYKNRRKGLKKIKIILR